ncbi:MAG TPA: thioesterase family protein [Syntrophorhabdaceae bacterium]
MYSTKIYYQDTDAGGVVYYGNYLRFFEKSWFEHLLSIGISLPEWEKVDVYVMVKTAFLDLREKLGYADMIQVTSTVKEIKNSYFILSHEIMKEERITTKGETKMVCVDRTGKPRRIPEPFRERLEKSLVSSL